MRGYNKQIIAVIIVVACAISFVFLYKASRHKIIETGLDTKQLYIENYIFTKLPSGKALIRIYGINKSNNDIDHFPVIIKYYTKGGKYLGKDESDLLVSTKAILKAGGKLNAQLNVVYPKNTDKVKIDINPVRDRLPLGNRNRRLWRPISNGVKQN